MTDEELDHLEALANAATEGPWTWDTYIVRADGRPIITADSAMDARFIAASREAVPALIAEVRRLRLLNTKGKPCRT